MARQVMTSAPNQLANRIFAPIASTYERWAAILSLGQDPRWRRAMVDALALGPGSKVLDAAAGTGSITRLLQAREFEVIAVDLTREMITRHPGPDRLLARAEELPFADESFDGVTFGYLLRYVEDPVDCLIELQRVLKSGGHLGMLEFGLPSGIWNRLWATYSSVLLPAAGRTIGRGWHEVGQFLKGSIETFHHNHPDIEAMWRAAGLVDVRVKRLSLGGGLVVWARKP
ncbi:MAG: class I SAM-dependent methyltransferase [Acidimicrobiia bacterium]